MKNEITDRLINFIDKSPTPWHCVENLKSELINNDFKELEQSKDWEVEAGQKYFINIEDSSIVAFSMPKKDKIEQIKIIGAHTDSPNLRIKQNSEDIVNRYQKVDVEIYGGVLINSWIDRDLSLAGRLFYKNKKGEINKKLFFINDAIARIPQLAIHLNREANSTGPIYNLESEIVPVFGVTDEENKEVVLEKIAQNAGVKPKDILSYEACFSLKEPGAYAGINQDFILCPRLDNQACCHAGLEALLKSKVPQNHLNILALFDHEEVGSTSSAGANSNILPSFLDRIFELLNISNEDKYKALANSIFLSADMSHAVHPTIAGKHGSFKPQINKGPVFKINQNQRYATNGINLAKLKNLAQNLKINTQMYYHRNDLPCGSTIGPFVSSKLGISTIDLGNPMLSMHSSREMGGSEDHEPMVKLMTGFYDQII